jgi:hypothetical protein
VGVETVPFSTIIRIFLRLCVEVHRILLARPALKVFCCYDFQFIDCLQVLWAGDGWVNTIDSSAPVWLNPSGKISLFNVVEFLCCTLDYASMVSPPPRRSLPVSFVGLYAPHAWFSFLPPPPPSSSLVMYHSVTYCISPLLCLGGRFGTIECVHARY